MNIKNSINSVQNATESGTVLDLNSLKSRLKTSTMLQEGVYFMCHTIDVLGQAKKHLYEAILKSEDNNSVILEAFNDYYIQSVRTCKESLNFFRDSAAEKIKNIKDFIESDKIIKDHKDSLKEDVKYYYDSGTHEGFNYTIKDIDVPHLEAYEQFNENIFSDVISTDINDLSIQSLQNSIANKDLEQEFRKFRSSILNRQDELTDTEFTKLLYSIFRDNSNEADYLELDISKVNSIIYDWFNFDEYENIINNDITRLSNALASILDKIQRASNANTDSTLVSFARLLPGDINVEYIDGVHIDNYSKQLPPDLMVQFNMYCKIKIELLQRFNDIVWLAICAKIDAIRAMYNQHRLILLDVCRAIDKPEYKQSIRSNILLSKDVKESGDK